MLRVEDLANRPDFTAGTLTISPARRLIEGPAGSANLEPIVMKVLLLLLDARGAVVTRDELFASAWGGVFVGDDSLNRAVARVRKVGAETAPGLFEVETIPRTGYRLTGEILEGAAPVPSPGPRSTPTISRRLVLGSSAGLGLAAIGGVGVWSLHSEDRRFRAHLQRGVDLLEYGDNSPLAAREISQAVALRPEDAAAQGLLAYALMANADDVNVRGAVSGIELAQQAASASLLRDPNEPNARLAQIQLDRVRLDLAETEDRLRAVLASAPRNIFVMRALWNLLQSAGRSHEALVFVNRAIAVKPLAAASNFPFAQILWIVGRTAEADRVIDRAMQFWPGHRFVRFARFTMFAFTGRPRAALAMLDNPAMTPQSFTPQSIALWRISLAALDQPTSANVAKARSANRDAVKADPKLASQAVLTLSSLGDVDSAFDIANNLLLFRDPLAAAPAAPGREPRASSNAWRFTPWLFVPPTAPMRADRRFAVLADGIGLTGYWRKRGIKPDYQLG